MRNRSIGRLDERSSARRLRKSELDAVRPVTPNRKLFPVTVDPDAGVITISISLMPYWLNTPFKFTFFVSFNPVILACPNSIRACPQLSCNSVEPSSVVICKLFPVIRLASMTKPPTPAIGNAANTELDKNKKKKKSTRQMLAADDINVKRRLFIFNIFVIKVPPNLLARNYGSVLAKPHSTIVKSSSSNSSILAIMFSIIVILISKSAICSLFSSIFSKSCCFSSFIFSKYLIRIGEY